MRKSGCPPPAVSEPPRPRTAEWRVMMLMIPPWLCRRELRAGIGQHLDPRDLRALQVAQEIDRIGNPPSVDQDGRGAGADQPHRPVRPHLHRRKPPQQIERVRAARLGRVADIVGLAVDRALLGRRGDDDVVLAGRRRRRSAAPAPAVAPRAESSAGPAAAARRARFAPRPNRGARPAPRLQRHRATHIRHARERGAPTLLLSRCLPVVVSPEGTCP